MNNDASKMIEKVQGDIVCGDDGYYFYWPTQNEGGFSAHNLRLIADTLDIMNQDWHEQFIKALSPK